MYAIETSPYIPAENHKMFAMISKKIMKYERKYEIITFRGNTLWAKRPNQPQTIMLDFTKIRITN